MTTVAMSAHLIRLRPAACFTAIRRSRSRGSMRVAAAAASTLIVSPVLP